MLDFIETYDDALSGEFCQQIIAQFDAHKRVVPGQTGHGVDPAKKDSLDLEISSLPDWRDVYSQLLDVTIRNLIAYFRKYPYALTGGLSLSVPNLETNTLQPLTADVISQLDEMSVGKYVFRVFRPGLINLQKYRRGSGGYHFWHSEIYPRDASCDTLHRVLLFMFYLNTVEEGGETEFYYQQRKLKPTRGQMVVAPAGFTHTHKGHVPISSDKYIATSWVLFQRAEELYRR